MVAPAGKAIILTHYCPEICSGRVDVARKLYAGDSFGVELENTAFALDTTTIVVRRPG